MMKRIEVRSQSEFDACVKAGNIAIVVDCSVAAWGNSSVVAWDNSTVEARGNSTVVAWGNSSVVAWGNSSVVARDNSFVEAWDNSFVEARGNSTVVARGNSSVVARGNAFLRLFSAFKVKASEHIVIYKHGSASEIEGGQVIEAKEEPKNGREWAEFNGIDINAAPYKVPDIDAKIYEQIKGNPNKLNMVNWHTDKCNEANWCNTTHCRAGYAICLAGKDGFDLEKKYGPELAGRMIYAVSRPDEDLPDFFAENEEAYEDIQKHALTQNDGK